MDRESTRNSHRMSRRLAFPIQFAGEATFPEIYAEPLPVVVQTLRRYATVAEVYVNLPDVAAGADRLVGQRVVGSRLGHIGTRVPGQPKIRATRVWGRFGEKNFLNGTRISRRKTALDPLGTRPYSPPRHDERHMGGHQGQVVVSANWCW